MIIFFSQIIPFPKELFEYKYSYIPKLEHAQWVSPSTLDPQRPLSDPIEMLGWTLGSNLIFRVSRLLSTKSDKVKWLTSSKQGWLNIQIESSLEYSWNFDSSFHQLFLIILFAFSVCVFKFFWILFNKAFSFHWN